jgi:NADPH:quinone reductase-like Zn-dependent oxidoreductase
VIPLTFPAILGVDVAGIVDVVGPGVDTLARGDSVFGQARQTYASLCVVKAADLAKVPNQIDLVEIATLPTVTTTGAQLAELAMRRRQRGTILVTGAVGSVGRSAVFVAKESGWSVISGVRNSQMQEAETIGIAEIAGACGRNSRYHFRFDRGSAHRQGKKQRRVRVCARGTRQRVGASERNCGDYAGETCPRHPDTDG